MNAYASVEHFSFKIDPETKAGIVIITPQALLVAGKLFTFEDVVELNNNQSVDYLFQTSNDPNKLDYAMHFIEGQKLITYELFEGTDRIGLSSSLPIFNRNRNSDIDSIMTVYKGITGGTTDGIRIAWYKGLKTSSTNEKLLKTDTKYIVRVTSGTANNVISIEFNWYEHLNIIE